MEKEAKTISRSFFSATAAIGLVSLLVFGAVWTLMERHRFMEDAKEARQEILNARRTYIQLEAERAADFIKIMNEKAEGRMRDFLRDRVLDAYSMAVGLYFQNRQQKSPEEIAKLIKDALRDVRFNEGRGYFFIIQSDGTQVLRPEHPKEEGRNLLKEPPTPQAEVFRDMCRIATEAGEGFYEYEWTKPGARGEQHAKIAYVKYFKPLQWVIGTGEYTEDYLTLVQREAVGYLESLSREKKNHLFAVQWDGLCLAGPGKGSNVLAVRDENGFPVVQELIKASRRGGGFVEYVMPQINGYDPRPKLSYSAPVPAWKWYVGYGEYVEDIERMAAAEKMRLREYFIENLTIIGLLSCGVLLLCLLLARFLSRRIQKELNLFQDFFQKASEQSEEAELDPGRLRYREDRRMAVLANRMIVQRTKAERALEKSQAYLGSILQAAQAGIGVVKGDILVQANQRLCAMTGYERGELLGQSWRRFFAEEADFNRADHIIRSRDLAIGVPGEEMALLWRARDGSAINVLLRWVAIEEHPEAREVAFTALDVTETRQAFESLAQSRQRFSEIINILPHAIFELDENGFFTFMSNESLGYGAEDIAQGLHALQMVVEEDKDKVAADMLLVAEGEAARGLEYTGRKKSGEAFPVAIYACRVLDNGKIRGFRGMVMDLTELKKAEGSLRREKEKAQQYLDVAEVMLVALDREGKVSLINNKGCRILRGVKEEIENEYWFTRFVPENERKDVFSVFQGLLKGETTELEYNESKVLTLDGRERVIAWHNTVLRNEQGEVSGVLSSGEDITEKQKAEQNLVQSEKRYREFVEHAPFGMYTMDLEGRFIYANQKLLEMTGYKLEDWLGKPFMPMVHPDDLPAVMERRDSRARGEGRDDPYEIRIYNSKGELLWVSLRSIDLMGRNEKGEYVLVGVQALVEDVTYKKQAEEERHQLEKQLRQSQKMEAIGTLAGGIAHDFNNILGIILSYTELLMRASQREQKEFKYLENIKVASLRASELVKQILTFSRREEVLARKPLSLAPLFKESVRFLKASFPATIRIVETIPKDLPQVVADPAQIQQVLLNLCANARQALKEGRGTLEISLAEKEIAQGDPLLSSGLPPGLYVEICVRDDGMGMSPETQQRIFEPYFTTKSQDEGTGLGLSVVHGIVKSHRGAVTIESEKGRGAAFFIFLPALEEEEKKKPAASGGLEQMPGGTESILFVDDEPYLAESGSIMLQGCGYDAVGLTDPRRALEMVRQDPRRFKVVVTDMTMPFMMGTDLAREILQIRPDMPILICTGFSSNLTESSARQLGLKGVLLKPLNALDVANAVRNALDEAG